MNPYRVRFAPSPTGSLHVGGARTALFNYLLAKKYSGKFILRIEDTDLERNTKTALAAQLRDLNWLKIQWDEGISTDEYKDLGPHGPYRQTERLDIYNKYIKELIENNKAYYVDSNNDNSSEIKVANKTGKNAVKIKVAMNKDYEFFDLVRGHIKINSNTLEDFIILRSNGLPVYNFGNAIDDYLMGITHVFRAEEHLYNTIKQLIIYEALGFSIPKFGHLSLILGHDKQKLSKRHGAVSVGAYRQNGILPEALINYMALLGWNPKDNTEFFELDELINRFDESGFNAAPAVFDEKKLEWLNSLHIKKMPDKLLFERMCEFDDSHVVNANADLVFKLLPIIKPLVPNLKMIVNYINLFNDELFNVNLGIQAGSNISNLKPVIKLWYYKLLAATEEFLTKEQLISIFESITRETQCSGKDLFQPLRLAVLGTPNGLDLLKIIPLIKVDSLKFRSNKVLNQLDAVVRT